MKANSPLRRIAIALLLVPVAALSAIVPVAKPEEVGFASDRLLRVNQVVQRAIDAKQIAGAVTVVSRRGRVAHFEAQGLMDIASKTPMRKDAIFRMASMSKPVTGVAIMMLIEEGKVRLNDPVSRFIPEFKDMKVAVAKPGAGGAAPGTTAAAPTTASAAPPSTTAAATTAQAAGRGRGRAPRPETMLVPASRAITVRDLLTHTSGLESGGLGTDDANRLAPRNTNSNLAEYIPKLGGVPLDFQPGTEWRYSSLAGMETLGRIVEIASGLTFDQFLKQRIFDPLGMKDTAFYEPDDKVFRVATLYGRANDDLQKQDTPSWLATRTLFSGGGGLWSTGEDYLQFAQMLVNGGVLNGKRLLSPRTVDLMASNQLGDLYAKGNRPGMGWGLSVEVVVDPVAANRRTSAGSFGWDGAFGTHFWVDRKEQIAGILLIQQGVQGQLNRDFENAVMQAIID
jgi:CubicO group peptidase (beta-lactamase class C family)